MQPNSSRYRGGSEATYSPIENKPKTVVESVKSSSKGVVVLFLAAIVLIFYALTRWIGGATFLVKDSWNQPTIDTYPTHHGTQSKTNLPQPKAISFSCPTNQTTAPTCQRTGTPYNPTTKQSDPSSHSCPEYFRWMYEDLRPWTANGITKEMVEKAQPHATFRLVVLDGKVYLRKYRPAFLTRAEFTIWGILQLIYRYPGRVPDLDIMFNCDDMPSIYSAGLQSSSPPPLFHYCKDGATLDIPFPDWSFWGWPEINIKPWVKLSEELKEGSERMKWKEREPYAFWKGNFKMGGNRMDLLKCNASEGKDWNARLYDQNWIVEVHGGFKTSNLANQCVHRYKIFVEGVAWSVSQKYIMGCDSPTLLIATRFIEFFQRGLQPGHHYWPIAEKDKCRSIKSAVDWGNSHPDQAEEMGKAGSGFVHEELKMENVYDYMLHLLTQYSKLLKYKPTIPDQATEICLESFVCAAEGRAKEFMVDSMVKETKVTEPCIMPPPYTPQELEDLLAKNAQSIQKLEALKKK